MADTDDVLAGMTESAMADFVAGKETETTTEETPSEETAPEETHAEETEEETEEQTEAEPEPSLEIDGQTYTAKEIRELRSAAMKAVDLERQMSEAESEKEELSVFRQMRDLANKYPALRDELSLVFQKFEQNPEAAGKPIEEREPSEEEKVRNAYLDQIIQEKVGSEIDNLVKGYAERYPDFVKMDDDWMYSVLRPAVEERFGTNVGIKEIRMTLNDMIVESGGLTAAEKKGANRLAERLAKEPPGSRVVKGGATRKDSAPPEVSFKGKSIDEMFALTDPSQFLKNGQ